MPLESIITATRYASPADAESADKTAVELGKASWLGWVQGAFWRICSRFYCRLVTQKPHSDKFIEMKPLGNRGGHQVNGPYQLVQVITANNDGTLNDSLPVGARNSLNKDPIDPLGDKPAPHSV